MASLALKFVHHQTAFPVAQLVAKVVLLRHLPRTTDIATCRPSQRRSQQSRQRYREKVWTAILYLQLERMRINGATRKEMVRKGRGWLEEARVIEKAWFRVFYIWGIGAFVYFRLISGTYFRDLGIHAAYLLRFLSFTSPWVRYWNVLCKEIASILIHGMLMYRMYNFLVIP
jgi:hypothetical protein